MASAQSDHDEATEADSLAGVAAGAVTFLTLAVAFGLMFLGVPYFWVAFPVGFGGLLPLSASLAKWYESNRADERERSHGYESATGRDDETDEAIDALRERYARGEIDDAEFERRVERLLETESVDDAEALLEASGDGVRDDRPSGDRTERDRDETGRANSERDEAERA